MNTNLRAILFGAAVAVVLTLTLNTVFAAQTPEIIRLDPVMVTAHANHFDADGNLKVIQLERVVVIAHKSAAV
jgi:hypothetical protein